MKKAEQERLARELAEVKQNQAKDAEKSGNSTTSEKPTRKGHGPRPQLRLKVIEEIHELAADQRECPSCGGEVVPLGDQFEEYEEITVIERQYARKQVKRRKYRCQCNGCVVTAPAPLRLVRGGRYSLDFSIHVAIDKYLDHLPLERQVRIMDRLGLEATSQTLFDQGAALAKVLAPVHRALALRVMAAPVLHADETRWPMLDSARASPWTVWARCTPDIAHYSILGSKSAKAGRRLFSGYSGIVVVDGYAVYELLAREGAGFRLANCWAHAQRKFKDIEEDHPMACGRILSLISQLYAVEDQVPGPFPGDSEAQSLRRRLREEHSRPVLAEIRDWAMTEVGLPQSGLGKAVRYMLKRWEGLTLFVENPLVALDNNAAERSLRGPVIGRKVHYGSKSQHGTEVAAILYTLLETAKLCSVEPAAYLKAAAEHALKKSGSVLLPHDFAG